MDSSGEVLWSVKLRQYRNEIKRLRDQGRYTLGHEYIKQLPTEIRNEQSVAIEAAQLYLVQGNYRRADEICLAACPPLTTQSREQGLGTDILEEESVCLALLHSFISISRFCRLQSALSVAESVHALWLSPHGSQKLLELSLDLPEETITESGKKIKAQNELLTSPTSALVVRDGEPLISEYRILMEFWYLKIVTSAAEQGLLDENATRSLASKRLEALYSFTQSRKRLREARFLVSFWISLLDTNPRVEAVLEGFLQVLQGENYDIEEAKTHLDLANWQLRSNILAKSQKCLSEARCLFQKAEHQHGSLDIENLEVSLSTSISEEKFFEEKQRIAEEYFSAECWQSGIGCLVFAIPRVFRIGNLKQQIQNSINRLLEIADKIGGELVKQTIFIDNVALALEHTPEYGSALKSLKDYLAHPPAEIGAKNHGLMLLCLRRAYAALGNTTEALHYASEASKVFDAGHSYIDKSDAAFEVALATADIGRRQPTRSAADALLYVKESMNLLSRGAELDRKNCYWQGEQSKLIQLAELEDYLFHFHHDEEARLRAQESFLRAQKAGSGVGSSLWLSSVAELKVREKYAAREFNSAVEIAKSAHKTCQGVPKITTFQIAQSFSRLATALHMRVRYRRQVRAAETGNEGSAQADIADVIELLAANQLAGEALKLYRTTGAAEVIISSTCHTWLLVQEVRAINNSAGPRLLKGYVHDISAAEEVCDALRRSSVSTENLQKLLEKRQIVSLTEHRKLYSYAVLAHLQLNDPTLAWIWTQKGKARALSDLFGVRALLPTQLLRAVQEDAEAKALYDAERKSHEEALVAAPEASIGAARKAQECRSKMLENPLLARVLAVREGAFRVDLGDSELEASLGMTGLSREKIKLVDWFIPTAETGLPQNIIRFVRDLDGTTSWCVLETSIQSVEKWIKKVFGFPPGLQPFLSRDNGNNVLAELNDLVAGLEELTAEDDLLILSPSGLLNQVPLHGLKIGGRALVDRNLIMYSSSAAISRQCQNRALALAERTDSQPRPAAFLAVYEQKTHAGRKERDRIWDNVQKLAGDFPGQAQRGPEVTKREFSARSEEVGWVHYHGHAIYSKADVLKSCLVLSDGADVYDSTFKGGPGSGRDDLTVAEIFNIDMLNNNPHFTIIACDSGSQDIGPGDEPLGIIPALLYAGATSVLGCLWPIYSPAGRIFSEHFYASLLEQKKGKDGAGKPVILNLAAALRDAVRKMMDKTNEATRQPHFWAAFVLYGCWFHVVH